MSAYPCPCCGYLTFDEPPGSYSICGICFWEDDAVQLRFPYVHGANRVTLVEAQRNFIELGACEARSLEFVRAPRADEPRDEQWRPIDAESDAFERFPSEPDEPFGLSYFNAIEDAESVIDLYWWRRRSGSKSASTEAP